MIAQQKELNLRALIIKPREGVARPTEVIRFQELSQPPFGLDGGILFPVNILEREARNPLGKFLKERCMPTGPTRAIQEGISEEPITSRSDYGEWYTSRGSSYYDVNYNYYINNGLSVPTANERRRLLSSHLQSDANLLRDWNIVMERLNAPTYNIEDRWRVMATIKQILLNDLVGLDYAYHTAVSYDVDFAQTQREVSQHVFEAAMDYYKTLLDISAYRQPNMDMNKFAICQRAVQLLRNIRGVVPDHIDNIRTNRETDAAGTTLAGVTSFKREFTPDKFPDGKLPPVLIPLLGGYDLGPALKAIGYPGKVVYVTSARKLNQEFTGKRREVLAVNVSDDLPHSIRRKGSQVILFDDSLGTSTTMGRITADLEAEGIYVTAIRTLFYNDDRHPKKERFMTFYSERYKPYFDSNIQTDSNSKGGDQLTSRVVWKEWLLFWRAYNLGRI